MQLVFWKVIFLLIMFALTCIFGLLPIKLLKVLRHKAAHIEHKRWPSLLLSLLSCFSGGVFLASCFLHLLPEVTSHLASIKNEQGWDVDYPIAELISCIGFFLIFFVEELVMALFPSIGHHPGHSHDTDDQRPHVHLHGEKHGYANEKQPIDTDSSTRNSALFVDGAGDNANTAASLNNNINSNGRTASNNSNSANNMFGNSKNNKIGDRRTDTNNDVNKQLLATHPENEVDDLHVTVINVSSSSPVPSQQQQQQQPARPQTQLQHAGSQSHFTSVSQRGDRNDCCANSVSSDDLSSSLTRSPPVTAPADGAAPPRVTDGLLCTDHTRSLPRLNVVQVARLWDALLIKTRSLSRAPSSTAGSEQARATSTSGGGNGTGSYFCSDQRCQRRPPRRRHEEALQPLVEINKDSSSSEEDGHGHHLHNSRSRSSTMMTCEQLAEPERCELETCAGVDEDPPILMSSRPHAHSHGIRSITFVLALSFHSVIEGIAFGVQSDVSNVLALFVTVIIHKVIVAFSVGLQLSRTHAHQLGWVVAAVVVLALMSPLGALGGMFIQMADSINDDAKDIVIMVMEGLAVGTFLYVTFFEVLSHERDNEHNNLLKLAAVIAGFTCIGLLRLFENHDHDQTAKVVSDETLKSSSTELASYTPNQYLRSQTPAIRQSSSGTNVIGSNRREQTTNDEERERQFEKDAFSLDEHQSDALDFERDPMTIRHRPTRDTTLHKVLNDTSYDPESYWAKPTEGNMRRVGHFSVEKQLDSSAEHDVERTALARCIHQLQHDLSATTNGFDDDSHDHDHGAVTTGPP